MIRKFSRIYAVVCLALVGAHAQNWTTVTATNITDLNQQKLAAGNLCFLGTDQNDTPISFGIGGGGQALARPYCTQVANGVATSFTVPNPANTSPANICYRVTATDSSTGQTVLRYTCVQFTGTTFNFDAYVPGFNLPLGISAPILSVGNLTITGTCTGCGSGGGGGATLETNGTNNASQSTLNFQNGSTVNGVQIQPSNPSGGNEQMAISGTLTVPGGGTGLTTLTAHDLYVGNGTSNPNAVATGNAGQILISNGSGADPTFQDPIVSYNYANLLNAISSTAQATGSAVRLSTFSGFGTLYITFASISGTYTSCGVQLKNYDSLGNSLNNGASISVTPANGTTTINVASASGLYTAAQMSATFSCSGYGSAGTVSVDYAPGLSVGIVNASIPVTESGMWTVQPGNTANTTPWLATVNQGGNSANVTASNALKVDGSAVTQPVSGTVTANAGTGTFNIQSNASVNVAQVAGTATDTNSGNKSAGTQRVVIATDQPQLTNALKVDGSAVTQPVSGTVTANAGTGTFNIQSNAAVNVAQIAGNTTSTAASGTQLVGVADGAGNKLTSNSTTFTSKFAVDVNLLGSDGTAFGTAGIVDENVKQIGGSAVSTATTGVQLVGIEGRAGTSFETTAGVLDHNLKNVGNSAVSTAATGVQLVGIEGHAGAAIDAATGSAPPANAILHAGLGSGATGGDLVGVPVGDTYKAVNISTATTTLLVTGVSGRQVRISAIHLIAAAADNVALIEGTGATCGTGTAGMAGGTTAASGYNLAANEGFAFGSGFGTVLQTVTTGDSVCVVTSAAVQLSGGLEYAIY